MFAPHEGFDEVVEVHRGNLQQGKNPRVAEYQGSSQWLMPQ